MIQEKNNSGTFLDTLNRKPTLYNWYFGIWIKVDQSHIFNLPDEVKINITEKFMIQAGAKYVNLGINFKPPLCNRPNEILPK